MNTLLENTPSENTLLEDTLLENTFLETTLLENTLSENTLLENTFSENTLVCITYGGVDDLVQNASISLLFDRYLHRAFPFVWNHPSNAFS